MGALLSTQQTWTALQHDGPNHLGLWLIRAVSNLSTAEHKGLLLGRARWHYVNDTADGVPAFGAERHGAVIHVLVWSVTTCDSFQQYLSSVELSPGMDLAVVLEYDADGRLSLTWNPLGFESLGVREGASESAPAFCCCLPAVEAPPLNPCLLIRSNEMVGWHRSRDRGGGAGQHGSSCGKAGLASRRRCRRVHPTAGARHGLHRRQHASAARAAGGGRGRRAARQWSRRQRVRFSWVVRLKQQLQHCTLIHPSPFCRWSLRAMWRALHSA